MIDSRAPVFTLTYDLCTWLLGRFDDHPGTLAAAICRDALALLESVTLALKARERERRLDEADERLIALRLKLRLAAEIGLLSEPQLLHALAQTDSIGRQIGGWIRSLDVR